MPTGTKIAVIVLVVLLGAAGLYYAFVAPPASNSKSSAARESGTPATAPAINGLSSQTPGTLAPAIPSVGTQPSPASSTPAVGALGGAPATTPTPTGLPAGAGTGAPRTQPGFTPGSLGNAGTGKGDVVGAGSGSTLAGGAATTPGTARPTPAPATGGTINGFPASTVPAVNAVPTGPTAPAPLAAGSPRPTPAGPTGTVPTGGTSPTSTGAPSTTTATGGEKTHTVASGETFSSISKKYFGSEKSWKVIAKANPTVDPSALKIGTKLRIPASDKTEAKSDEKLASKPETRSTPTTASSGSGDSHVVASGETLASIARKYYGNTKYWERLYKENRDVIGSDPAALKVGQKLKVPAKSSVVGETAGR